MNRLISLLLVLLISVSASAQSGGMWGSRGFSRDFVVFGDILYSADGRGVSVYRTGSTIERIDVEPSDDETFELALADNELFVATAGGVLRYHVIPDRTLRYVDELKERDLDAIAAGTLALATAKGRTITLRNRTDFSPIAEVGVGGDVDALVFAGGILYASVEGEGLRVIDPQGNVIALLAVGARSLALEGNRLYAAAGPAGLTVIDVSDPDRPRVIGNGGAGEVNMTGVAVSGGRAFAFQPPDRLYAFDVSGAPRLVHTVTLPVSVIAAAGNRVFIAGENVDMYGLERATGVPVRALDATTLNTTAEFRDLAGPVSGADTDGSVAYIVDPPFFRVLDVSKTATPREIAAIEVPRIQDSVRVKRGLAIIYGRGLVNLVDVSNPFKPKYLGTYDSLGIPPSAAAIARDTIVEANYASGLHVVDYSDPANPVQIAGRIWHYLDLVASDDVIYAVLQNAVLVADLTNRNSVVDVTEPSYGAEQVALAPAAAPRPDFLLIRTPTTLHILDLTADRFRPVEVAAVPIDGATLMGVNDRNAFLSIRGSLWRVDLRAPSGAVDSGWRVTSPMQIGGSGEKVVVADRYSVRVFGPDTAAPKFPEIMRRRTVRK